MTVHPGNSARCTGHRTGWYSKVMFLPDALAGVMGMTPSTLAPSVSLDVGTDA